MQRLSLSQRVKHSRNGLFAGALCLGAVGLYAAELTVDDSLFALTEGRSLTTVLPCTETDPKNIKKNQNIASAIKFLNLDESRITFKGCDNLPFKTTQLSAGKEIKYVVFYPKNIPEEKLLAPILHELSHVLQIEMTGGIEKLRSKYVRQKRIELGADYITGIMYAVIFVKNPLNQFEQNIHLTGLYVEAKIDEHGSPRERDQAFRFGAFEDDETLKKDARELHDLFQKDIYGKIL